MQRSTALDQVHSVLNKIRTYVEEHDTFDDIAELNTKYVPATLQDEITWLADMAERLLAADPIIPDHDDAVAEPAQPNATTGTT